MARSGSARGWLALGLILAVCSVASLVALWPDRRPPASIKPGAVTSVAYEQGVSFRYPANWHWQTYSVASAGMVQPLGVLSDRPLGRLCRTTSPDTVECGGPTSMAGRAVVAGWSNGLVKTDLLNASKAERRPRGGFWYDGEPRPADCPSDATREVALTLPRGGSTDGQEVTGTQMVGCIAAPDPGPFVRALRAVASSTSLES